MKEVKTINETKEEEAINGMKEELQMEQEDG